MRFAYADPPYLGMCSYYQHSHGEGGGCWDDIETHRLLIDELSDYDGWAMSLHSPSLRHILPLCPEDVRVMAWCKPFTAWNKGVKPAYAWEPVIVKPSGRKVTKAATARDFCMVNATLKRGFRGAKPDGLVWWLLDVLDVQVDDEFSDLFYGSGAVTEAYERWRAQQPLGLSV